MSAASIASRPWLPSLPGGGDPTPKARRSQAANTRYRLRGALEVVSGQVLSTTGAKMGVTGLCAFLERRRAAAPQPGLVLVWDHWPVHRHPAVLAQAAALHIQLRWLPPYAPWTNPSEKLWRWLKQTLAHHHRLADRWDDLKAAAGAFLDQFAAGSTDLLRYTGLLPD